MFYCLDRFIEDYDLKPPFLDIGCGIGDLCAYLGKRGWNGKGIDFSPGAIAQARDRLVSFPNLVVEEKNLFDETEGRYYTIFLWDIIEHIENDRTALEKAASLLLPGGTILIAVPSNPREWRWDDEMVGHYRRYTMDGLAMLMREVGLEPLKFWDFTFPIFWAMRRGYTWLKSKPRSYENSLEERTRASATARAWYIPIVADLLDNESILWKIIYQFQFTLFRNAVHWGHEFLALARQRT
jgi:SAM-dependent methyltransferase